MSERLRVRSWEEVLMALRRCGVECLPHEGRSHVTLVRGATKRTYLMKLNKVPADVQEVILFALELDRRSYVQALGCHPTVQ